MAMNVENLSIACRGWFHPDWNGSFYPEDLPEDWQLDFYSTQFSQVLVPQQQWMSWSEQNVEEFADLLEGEDFGFVFEVSEEFHGLEEQLKMIQHGLGELFYSLFIVKELGVRLNEYPVTQVGCVPGKNVWSWVWQNTVFSGIPVARFSLEELSIEEQKELISSFMASLPDGVEGGVLFVENINVAAIKEMQVIAELMGY